MLEVTKTNRENSLSPHTKSQSLMVYAKPVGHHRKKTRRQPQEKRKRVIQEQGQTNQKKKKQDKANQKNVPASDKDLRITISFTALNTAFTLLVSVAQVTCM